LVRRTLTLHEKLLRWGGIAGVIAGASFVTIGLLGFIGSDTYLGWFGSDSFFDMYEGTSVVFVGVDPELNAPL
jgi:hypothetical protein